MRRQFVYENNVTKGKGWPGVKAVFCAGCQTKVSADEVALNQRLLGTQIGRFFCTACLSRQLDTTPEHLMKLFARFKKMGCAYFTRLMEDPSDEKNDHM